MLSNSVIASCMARSSCEFSLRLLCGRKVGVLYVVEVWLVSDWVRVVVFIFFFFFRFRFKWGCCCWS